MIPKRLVPGTDKEVSLLVMGCVVWGPDRYDERIGVYDKYFELGGNMLDMSHCYGQGACASCYGRWFKERGLGHDQVMLFDKGCHPYGEPRVTPEIMESDLDVELAAFGREKVEFWTFHRDNPDVPLEPLMAKAAELQQKGKVDHFGGSNWRVERIQEWNDLAAKGYGPPMTHNNPNLSLATVNEPMWDGAHTIEPHEVEWHTQTQLPLFSWSSVGGGWFARVDTQDVNRVYNNPVNVARRERVESMAAEKGMSPSQVALVYALSQPFPTWCLVGPQSPEQMTDLASVSSMTFSDAERIWLESGEGG